MTENQNNNMDVDGTKLSVEAVDDLPVQAVVPQTVTTEQVQRRTFSHWPRFSSQPTDRLIEAGLYGCNVNDRVICIYCNLICQQWVSSDDPSEVHRTLSPNCSYVRSKLMQPRGPTLQPSPPLRIINGDLSPTVNVATSPTFASSATNLLQHEEIVPKFSHSPTYASIGQRKKSFINWLNKNLPSTDDLVRAGFFYTGTRDIVICFYCNGSLDNWKSNDDPLVEHAQRFPHCRYARHLCGDELYLRILRSQRRQQEQLSASEWNERNAGNGSDANPLAINRLLCISDDSVLSRLVAARLDLPISQRLMNTDFSLSIIRRCWEDQLRIKEEDFISSEDLLVACKILQKQMPHINGNRENIVIPSVRMAEIRRLEAVRLRQASATERVSRNAVTTDNPTPSNLCVICVTKEKRLAFIPCGHLATCVSCAYALNSCLLCRRPIEAYFRTYI